MAKLLGFQKTKSEDNSDKILNLVTSSYLNRTKGGEFNTVEEVDGLLDTLKGMPQTLPVQQKIADLTNKKLQIAGKLEDILSQKNVFDMDLQQGLDTAAKNNFKDMKGLIGSYAAIYGDAADRYDQDVFSKVSEKYGTTGSIPDDTLKYRKELQDKAKFYASLFNAYNVKDPKTGEVGHLNADAYAVQLDTNPTNGSVTHLEIVPSGSVDDKNYLRTEVGVNVVDGLPNKKLPIYLRTFDGGLTSDGKTIRSAQLGNITYDSVPTQKKDEDIGGAGIGILKPQKEKAGFWNTVNIFNDSPEEKLNNSIDSIKKNGISLSSGAYKYDSNDVPNDAVLRMGNRTFYSTGKDGEVLEIKGANSQEKNDNLNKYLTGIGKDPAKQLPYFVTRDYLVAPDGSSRVKGSVDANYFAPPVPPAPSSTFNTSSPQSSLPPAPSNIDSTGTALQAPEGMGFFSNRVNRESPPKTGTESASGKVSISDVIEKGKSFFRSKVA